MCFKFKCLRCLFWCNQNSSLYSQLVLGWVLWKSCSLNQNHLKWRVSTRPQLEPGKLGWKHPKRKNGGLLAGISAFKIGINGFGEGSCHWQSVLGSHCEWTGSSGASWININTQKVLLRKSNHKPCLANSVILNLFSHGLHTGEYKQTKANR